MTDRSHPTPQLEAVRSIVAELDQARTPDPARISTAFRELQEAKRDYSHPATIARLEMRLREARSTPRASREAIREIEARLRVAQDKWKATTKAERKPSNHRPHTANRKPSQGEWNSERADSLKATRLAREKARLEKAQRESAEAAVLRTRKLELEAKARASSSPAKSANVEAINAARIEAILAAIERMATPDPARIAQALRTERPAVRRAVTKHLQRKQAV